MIRRNAFLAAALAALPVLHTHAEDPDSPYLEENGAVVIEAEAQAFDETYFAFANTIQGHSGSGYLVGKINSYNTPGRGTVSCPLKITTSGRYQLSWKSRITQGTSSTDANDTWARMLDSESNPIAPVPNEMHAASAGWHKSYMNRANAWSYDASNKDNDPHSISWQLEAGKTYTFQFSVRSEGHGLDRIVLWDTSRHAFANTLTGKNSQRALLDPLPPSRTEAEVAYDTDNDGLPNEWESQYGTDATSLAPDSDHDRDQLPALLEFALGTDPTLPTASPSLSKVEIDGTLYLSYNYTRSLTAAARVSIRPLYSNGLASWSDEHLEIEENGQAIDESTVAARALLPAASLPPPHFFQLASEKR